MTALWKSVRFKETVQKKKNMSTEEETCAQAFCHWMFFVAMSVSTLTTATIYRCYIKGLRYCGFVAHLSTNQRRVFPHIMVQSMLVQVLCKNVISFAQPGLTCSSASDLVKACRCGTESFSRAGYRTLCPSTGPSVTEEGRTGNGHVPGPASDKTYTVPELYWFIHRYKRKPDQRASGGE